MKKLVLGLALGLCLAAGPALAATATSNLAVSANISNNCSISTTPLAFSTYDPIVTNAATPLDGTGTVTITCTKGAATTMGLGLGQNAAGSVRRMTDGSSNFMTYEAYQPPDNVPGTACTYATPVVWGTAGSNLFTPTAAPSRAGRTYNVCGRVAPGQDLPSGTYNDTVVASVNF